MSSTSFPFPVLTPEEISGAILGAGNTTPGKDRIPTAVLRLAWPHISDTVPSLFQACIDIGHHPQCFRTTILAIIGKPNKADVSSPRSYRPIALLSVLGKGFERVVARRMSWIAIRFKVLATQHFGALPLRSSVDLTTCLTHDVEAALAKELTASVATLDIKGAFDTVLLGRLVKRIREQGWPPNLCNWIGSFATERTVCIRLDGEAGAPRAINCGLPQGSPISPILFMLYTSLLYKLEGLRNAFGYADDVAIMESSPSLEENSPKIRSAVNQALSWGEEEGLKFDPSKSELLHFSRKHRDKGRSPQVSTNSFSISENTERPYLKWLGINFDKKITFKYHLQIQAAKALKVANALCCFGNTVRGVPPHLTRQAVTACVLPIANFGAETWWPRVYRKKGDKIVSNRVGQHLAKLEKVYSTAARAILPVYRTVPLPALLREAGLTPSEIALDNISGRAAIRIRKLDPRHPLFRLGQKLLLTPALTRLARSYTQIPALEQFNPLFLPPWDIPEQEREAFNRVCGPLGAASSRANLFRELLLNIPQSDILVYSDGSKASDGNSGRGYAIHQLGRLIQTNAFPLGKGKEIYDAEAYAALKGIKAARALSTTRFSKNLWLFIDNLEVAKKLTTKAATTSSQKVFIDAIEADKGWKTRTRLPHISEGEIKVR